MNHRTNEHRTPIAALLRRRAQHEEQRTLQRELASFTTANDLTELAAILDRHADDDAASVRDAVAWTRAA